MEDAAARGAHGPPGGAAEVEGEAARGMFCGLGHDDLRFGLAAGAMPLSGEGGASPGPERGLVWSSSWRLTASDFLQFLQDAFLKEVGC
jgi:hypothetical protein